METPEITEGKGYGPVVSANIWLPTDLDFNYRFIEERAIVRPSATQFGEEVPAEFSLLSLTTDGDYAFLPRHLFDDCEELLPEDCERLDYSALFDRYDFHSSITLRGNQLSAWDALCCAGNGVLVLSCGKGKTELGLLKAADRGYATLVLVTNGALAVQWKNRAMQRLGLREDEIGIIEGGLHLRPTKKRPVSPWYLPFVIVVIHNIVQHPEKIPHDIRVRFGTVLFDEAHHLPAKVFSTAGNMFYGARFALTASPRRDDGMEKILYAACGGIIYQDLESQWPAAVHRHQTVLTVNTADRATRKAVMNIRGKWHLSKSYGYLARHAQRNEEIAKLVAQLYRSKRRIIIFSHSQEHPAILQAALKLYGVRDVGTITGATPSDDRLAVLDSHMVVVATVGVGAEGLDCPLVDTIVMATPFFSQRLFDQCKGRCERLIDGERKGKQPPMLWLIEDPNVPFFDTLNEALRKRVGVV